MTYRTALFVAALIFVLGLGAGFALDRWLHRPIRAGGFVVSGLIPAGVSPAPTGAGSPVPPCIIDCEPTDPTGDGEVEPTPDSETQAQCYGDGSIPCPAPGRIRPWIGICPFPPFINQVCQQET